MKTDVLSQRHIDQLSDELGKAAGITPEQARRVLDVLRIDKLQHNLAAMHEVLQNDSAVRALGLSRAEGSQELEKIQARGLALTRLRLVIRPNVAAGVLG
ncbi:MAG TPA: hypothetical protein VES67_15060 [Vicinamibacterales bacterium]|nr:hypothetical protein [Vicinamibacterales bacterium]